RVRTQLKPGDYLIVQFGHNDGGLESDVERIRARASLPGNGDETRATENGGEPIHTYGWYLRRYIREARAQGATPLVASLVPRNSWRDGKVVRGQDTSYVLWSRQAAEEEGAFWINLNHIVSETMDELGEDFATGALFRPDDPTHTITLGAQLNAMSVVRGLKALGPSLPLVEFLLPAAEALEPARDDLVVAGQVTSPPARDRRSGGGAGPH